MSEEFQKHAFEAFTAAKCVPTMDLIWSTSEINEIHSMTMELLTYPYMDLFFGEDAENYRYAHLCDCLCVIPYLCCVDEYQHKVFEHPEMTPAQRRAAWRESEKSLMSRTGGLGAPRGQAFWPVRGPTLHRYGEQLQGELRWKGMVIGASEGTEVKAIADGRVILADWLQGYGLVVVVEHGKGDMSLYGYNQSALVSVGSQVRAGQPIALVGSSGGQGRPSLYFEIRRQGQAVNPQPWLGR